MYTLTTIQPDGSMTVAQQPTRPTLEQLQAAVGGYVELIPYFDNHQGQGCKAYGDEEGKLKGKPLNPEATRLWAEAVRPHALADHLVGPVVIVTADNAQELFSL